MTEKTEGYFGLDPKYSRIGATPPPDSRLAQKLVSPRVVRVEIVKPAEHYTSFILNVSYDENKNISLYDAR